jgi:hypothetical protein
MSKMTAGMATFTLTWEEFQEYYEYVYPAALPERSKTSFTVGILAVLIWLAFGAYLINVIPVENKTIATMLLILLTLILILLVFSDKARTAQIDKRKKQGLRLAYERDYADPQSFSSDGVQWTLQSKAGKRETLWTGLSSASWLQNVVVFAAKDHFAVVPKRVFSSEQVELMRQLAHGGQGQRMAFEVPFLDYALVEIPGSWRRNPLTPLYCLAGIALVLLALSTEQDSFLPSSWRCLLGVLCLGIAFLTAQVLYYWLKYVRHRENGEVAWDAEFSERGASARTAKTDVFLAWDNFEKFKESKRCILLYLRSPVERYYFLVKGCVSLEQQTTVRQLLQAKLGDSATT